MWLTGSQYRYDSDIVYKEFTQHFRKGDFILKVLSVTMVWGTHMLSCTYLEVRRQFCGVGSPFFPLLEFQGQAQILWIVFLYLLNHLNSATLRIILIFVLFYFSVRKLPFWVWWASSLVFKDPSGSCSMRLSGIQHMKCTGKPGVIGCLHCEQWRSIVAGL